MMISLIYRVVFVSFCFTFKPLTHSIYAALNFSHLTISAMLVPFHQEKVEILTTSSSLPIHIINPTIIHSSVYFRALHLHFVTHLSLPDKTRSVLSTPSLMFKSLILHSVTLDHSPQTGILYNEGSGHADYL